ncbi:betaine/proline/choline family ABC transporter ATP-binding protein [Sulfitobacter mediterraneus]|uniref:quaternary amine ABC transporter ATP-binding protein n=1 Tax=Sulfitobacter mediterraneus TaxID=83219 RepID=UPI001939653D|nr:betaine/proline/choline family ABC transporter ATP-binding protein [Sulfitobacter mediterraneus]MBM1558741.1 betaine/proline/choline family ABC transporter ATP-binding protein [Sulfitobacter mediterraneus]MBM1569623.1 betaine/proline/choline family ABC transporter ATP-binding protein [Sulfitobacter mediterraneus]MBM1573154.1 betaine/proline/choline family ABC transporter ATP-binding protein [Sulfitobacter mediterraneus]MBM1577230.1 betaine/proline/choline family ABC transporter ATP-binding p
MSRNVMLDCSNVWKLYGPQADAFLTAHNGAPSDADLAKAKMIGAVRGADVQIQDGEIFVIMGLSGSGKSTLVRCLSRLVEPSAGAINFEGQDLLTISEADLIEIRRKKMGMVFQHFALLPHLTVLQNVAFPLDVQGVDRTTREARAHEMIETVGLKGREDYYPRQLSGGQQQRVGIARSLVTEPDLWFLDEPFSALDPLIRREMQDEFLRLQSMLKKTIVFITHDFDEAIRLADRIAVMKDGRIEQTATPEELMTNPATPYVAEFTRHVNRSKVVKLRSIAVPVDPDATYAGDLPARMTVAEAMEQIDAAADPFKVVEASGEVIGAVDAQTAISVMIGRSAK